MSNWPPPAGFVPTQPGGIVGQGPPGPPGPQGPNWQVGTGLGLNTGTTPSTVYLANTAVSAGNYTSSNLTIDAQGRITAAANGAGGTLTSITAGAGLTGGTITTSGTIALASPIAASFMPGYTGDVTAPVGSTVNTLATVNSNIGTWNNITINAKGLATAGSNVAYLTGNQTITLSGDVSGSGTTAIPVTLATVNSNIGTYNNITINAKGLATAGSNVAYLTAAVTSVATGTGLTGGTITGTGTISMANMAANSVKGNNTGAAAAPIDMTVAQAMTLLGAAPLASPAFTGNVTVTGSLTLGGTLTCANNANPTLNASVSANYTVLYAMDGTGASRCLMLGNTASAGLNLHRNATHYFQDVNGATNFAQIDANGLVVGSPAGGSKGAGTVNATTVYAGGVALTSDARLKRDIAPLPDGCLRLVGAIAPKQFRFIEPPPQEAAGPHDLVPDGMTLTPAGPPGWFERRHWGFIAQEVQAAMTGHEFGGVDEDAAGNLALSPSDMVAVLWKAVQELSARLAALEGSGTRH